MLLANDWGEPGALQTPSARFGAAGGARLQVSRAWPYTRATVMLQPLDGFEFGFRYTGIDNQSYGPVAPGQSYKDKSIDLRLRLLQEGNWRPAVALGLRDFGGTGLFAGEYLVGSKRLGDWDLSLGLGWGYLGTRAHAANPLKLLGRRFEQRPAPQVGQGGTANLGDAFRGPVAAFAGVQWAAPSGRWVLRAELDPNDYQREPFEPLRKPRTPLNAGVVWRATPHVDLALGRSRGDTWQLALTLHTGAQGLGAIALDAPKPLDRATLAGLPALPRCTAPCADDAVAAQLLRQAGWRLVARQAGADGVLRAGVEIDDSVFLHERLQALWAVLHATSAPEVAVFDVQLQERGMPLAQARLDRAAWVLDRASLVPPSRRAVAQTLQPPAAPAARLPAPLAAPPALDWSWQPSYAQVLGGPDAFLLFQLGARLNAEWRLAPSTWVTGALDLRLLDNFDKFSFTADSQLPRVRTFAREYATTSRLTMPVLQLTHARALGAGHYAAAYGGWLEPMYAGFGAEWLWRPWAGRWAVGADLNLVRQRAFRQDLSLRDYGVTTGHLQLHWDTGWNGVQARAWAGRYLAGDRGVTLDLGRVFANGVAVGAWATRTNVSAEQFGEGSFDKGIYLTIPFDVMLPWPSSGKARLLWTPLTRDGGARLSRRHTLDELTAAGQRGAWVLGPGAAGP